MRDQPEAELPEIGRNRGMELFIVWFVIEGALAGYAWRTAEAYNPEGNGLFNMIEATMLSQAWLKIAVALLTAIFTSIAFGIGIIAQRLRVIARINRAGHLAVLEELRRRG